MSAAPITDEEARAMAAQGARLLGLAPDDASLTAIAANLKVLTALHAQFVDLPLDDHLDPAAVMRL
jgi:hypothetical protein